MRRPWRYYIGLFWLACCAGVTLFMLMGALSPVVGP